MRQIRPPPGWMTEIVGEGNEAIAQVPVSSQVDQPGPSGRQRHASSRLVASRRSSLDSDLASRPSSRLKRSSCSRVKEEKVYSVPTTSESESELVPVSLCRVQSALPRRRENTAPRARTGAKTRPSSKLSCSDLNLSPLHVIVKCYSIHCTGGVPGELI